MIRFQFDNECDFFEIDPVAYAPALGERGLATLPGEAGRDRRQAQPQALRRATTQLVEARTGTPGAAGWRRITSAASWSGTRVASPSGTGTWTRSSPPTPVTGRSPPGWRTPPRLSPRSASSTSPSTGPDKPPGSTSATRPPKRPGTGANCWPNTDPTRNCPPGWRCSGGGRRRRTRPRCTSGPERPGRPTPTRWGQPSSARPREAVLVRVVRAGRSHPRVGSRPLPHPLTSRACGRSWPSCYEKVDPLAVLPIHTRVVLADLEHADAGFYRSAARRLARMRKLASGSPEAAEVDELIADLRETPPTPSPPATGVRQGRVAVVGSPLVSRLCPARSRRPSWPISTGPSP